MSADDDAGPAPRDDDAPPEDERPRQRPVAVVFIVFFAVWKVYEAIVAETVRATVAPSLYALGLGGFAVSILGPRSLQLLAFFAGAILCLVAIAFEVQS